MKKFLTFVLLWVTFFCYAKLAMKLETSRKNYLKYEPVVTRLTIRNDSGHTMVFGEHTKLRGKLKFEIFDSKSNLCPELSDAQPALRGLLLQPGETRSVIIKLSDFYDLRRCGGYNARAFVSHPHLTNTFQSNSTSFSINEGVVLWSRMVGVPDILNRDKSSKIKTRIYTVKTLFDGNKKVLFLIIEDEKTVYAVKKIGYENGRLRPICEVDPLSYLHILLGVSPRDFVYFVYDTSGELKKREYYQKTNTIPVLRRNYRTGVVKVVGGERVKRKVEDRFASEDV